MTAASIPMTDAPVHFRIKSVAFAALCFHAFFATTDFGGQLKPEYGAAVALLLMLAAGGAPWRELARLPAVRVLAVLIVFLVAHAAYATTIIPALGFSKQLTAAAELVRLGVFSCVVGWWLSLMPRKVPLLFGLMIVGLLVTVAAYMPWASLPQIWDGQLRPKFGMPENLGGQLAALGGWLSLCLLVKSWNAHGRFRRRRVLMAVCLLAYIGSFCALLFSQSRGAWLAFAATLPVIVFGIWYTRKRHADGAVPWPPLAAVALVSLLLLAGARDIVAQRFAGAERLLPDAIATQGQATSKASSHRPPPDPSVDSGRATEARATESPPAKPVTAAHGPTADELNNKAVSVRLLLYKLGVERWQQRPLLGWGLRSTSALIAGSGLDLSGQRHAHMHSAYLDALVGMGLIGAGLLGLFLLLLVRELVLAWRSGIISNATYWMVAGCIGIVLVANGFDSLLWRLDYARAPLEIVFGCCVAYGLIRRRSSS